MSAVSASRQAVYRVGTSAVQASRQAVYRVLNSVSNTRQAVYRVLQLTGFTITNAAPNAPVSLALVGGMPTNDTTPSFTWVFSDADPNDVQSGYQAYIVPTAGGSHYWESGDITSGSGAATVGTALPLGLWTFGVLTRDQENEWGVPATLEFEATDANLLAPTVDIISPLFDADVSGTIDINADLSDDVGVTAWAVAIDGSVLSSGTVDPVNPALSISVSWNSITSANGTVTISVTATDTDAYETTTDVVVTTINIIPISEEVLFSTLFDVESQLGDRTLTYMGMAMRLWDTSGGLSQLQRRLWMGVHTGAESTDVADYTNIPFESYTTPPGGDGTEHIAIGFTGLSNATKLQICVRSRPVRPEPGYILTGALNAIRLIERTADVLVLCTEPDEIFSFVNSSLTQLVDLASAVPGETPVDLAWYAPTADPTGKFAVCYPSQIRFYDPDIEDLMQVILPPAGTWTSICILNEILYCGADNGDGSGSIYAFTYPSFRLMGKTDAPVDVLRSFGDTSVVIGAGPKIYTLVGNAMSFVYDTGESNIRSLAIMNNISYAGTSSAGKIFRSAPSWGEEVDLTIDKILSLCAYRDADGVVYLYGGGTSSALYRRADAAIWQSVWSFKNTTAINDMLRLTDVAGDEYLLIATSSGMDARLYRYDVVAAKDNELIGTHFANLPVAMVQGGAT